MVSSTYNPGTYTLIALILIGSWADLFFGGEGGYMDQTVRHDITVIVLKVSLNTITHITRYYNTYIVS